MASHIPSVNLLPKQQKSSVNTFLSWALNTGRVIIILTEAIAIAAFFYRFSLDRQWSDLNDKIIQNQQTLASWKPKEEQFRNLQSRLTLSAEINDQAAQKVSIFKDVTGFAQKGILFNTIAVEKKTIEIEATADSVASLVSLVDTVKAYPNINFIILNRIENKTSNATIVVKITGVLKKNLQ